jgi:hypothetical protein
MMTTEKQIAANRANAKRSTGPKTFEGKIRSSVNSRKHGLSAKTIVIDGEDPAEFDELLSSLIKQFNPDPGCEYELVSLLANTFWRLRRIPLFEARSFRPQQSEIAYGDPRFKRFIEGETACMEIMNEMATRVLPNPDGSFPNRSTETRNPSKEDDDFEKRVRARFEELFPPEANQPLTSPSESQEMLAKISRYETSLMNSMNRTLNTLIRLQSMRGKHADRQSIDSRE